MKIAIVRGDFANPWELQNFEPLITKHNFTLFTGLYPLFETHTIHLDKKPLFSPVDLNLGNISRAKMALMNRVFVDAHVLYGLEDNLRGFDIVHCAETYYSYSRQSILSKRRGSVKKIVSTVWENKPFNNQAIWGRDNYKKMALRDVDMFLAVTDEARLALISEGCDSNKVKVLHPGVNLNKFKPLKISRFLGIEKNSKVKILFVGRLEPEKGILELIASLIELNEQSFEFIIAGVGSLEKDIKRLIERDRIRNFHMIGQVGYEQMPQLYSICDILIHYPLGAVNWKEQFGMVLVEAMSCGLPVVGLDNGSVKEVVASGGIVTDARFFKDALKRVVLNKHLRLRLAAYAVKLARLKYGSESYARSLDKIYLELLE